MRTRRDLTRGGFSHLVLMTPEPNINKCQTGIYRGFLSRYNKPTTNDRTTKGGHVRRTTFRSTLAGVLLPLALLGGVGAALVVPAPSATASPVHPPGDALIPVGAVNSPYYKLSKTKKAQLNAAASIRAYALSKSGKTLYYDKANKYDKGQTMTRRYFAATYLWKGLSVKHISKAELKKVRALSARWPKYKSCAGRSGYARNVKNHTFTLWFNSCETRIIILVSGVAGVVVAAASPAAGPAWPAPAVAAAALAIGAIVMADARDMSTKKAIYWVVAATGPSVMKVTTAWVYPQ